MATNRHDLLERVRDAIDNARALTLKTITYLPRERAPIDITDSLDYVRGMKSFKGEIVDALATIGNVSAKRRCTSSSSFTRSAEGKRRRYPPGGAGFCPAYR